VWSIDVCKGKIICSESQDFARALDPATCPLQSPPPLTLPTPSAPPIDCPPLLPPGWPMTEAGRASCVRVVQGDMSDKDPFYQVVVGRLSSCMHQKPRQREHLQWWGTCFRKKNVLVVCYSTNYQTFGIWGYLYFFAHLKISKTVWKILNTVYNGSFNSQKEKPKKF
jgi:hypothetical protein